MAVLRQESFSIALEGFQIKTLDRVAAPN
jgi:hypothetical protein